MKLTVLNWLLNWIINHVGKVIELLFRLILFMLPLGIYLIVLQYRTKPSSTSSISAFTTDNSVWQHIYPGFMLVAKDKNEFKNFASLVNIKFQEWVSRNKYTIAMIFMATMVILMITLVK